MNVLLVIADTLRADHLGCYGYASLTTPNIDSFAKQGFTYHAAIAPDIPTHPAFTTVLTGVDSSLHGIVCHKGQQLLATNLPLLAERLRQFGLVTVSIDNLVNLGRGSAPWFARGSDFYSGFQYNPGIGQDGEITDRCVSYMERLRDQSFFLMVHYWSAHMPYLPPPEYRSRFYPRASQHASQTSIHHLLGVCPEYYSLVLDEMELDGVADLGGIIAQYDGAIAFLDANIGRLLATLERLDLFGDTLIILMGDHGECFGEGNLYFDHYGLYDAVVRVPLIVRPPEATPESVRALISTADLADAIMQTVHATQRGGSPSHVWSEALCSRHRSHMFLTEATRQATRGVRTDRWKLIVPIVESERGEPILDVYGNPRAADVLLFDVLADPMERVDVSGQHPDIVADLSSRLDESVANSTSHFGYDPVRRYAPSYPHERMLQELRKRQANREQLARHTLATVLRKAAAQF